MANRIAEIRAEKGLTLTEVAKRAGTTPAQIQKLEREERRLTVDWMRRLGHAMDVEPSALLHAADLEKPGSRVSALAAVLERFAGTERVLAEELAAEFLEMLLRYRGSVQPKSPLHLATPPDLSTNQIDMTRTLIRLSRNLAQMLDQPADKRDIRPRTGG